MLWIIKETLMGSIFCKTTSENTAISWLSYNRIQPGSRRNNHQEEEYLKRSIYYLPKIQRHCRQKKMWLSPSHSQSLLSPPMVGLSYRPVFCRYLGQLLSINSNWVTAHWHITSIVRKVPERKNWQIHTCVIDEAVGSHIWVRGRSSPGLQL